MYTYFRHFTLSTPFLIYYFVIYSRWLLIYLFSSERHWYKESLLSRCLGLESTHKSLPTTSAIHTRLCVDLQWNFCSVLPLSHNFLEGFPRATLSITFHYNELSCVMVHIQWVLYPYINCDLRLSIVLSYHQFEQLCPFCRSYIATFIQMSPDPSVICNPN